ncbi:hypothetical protein [Bradyrhizobium sp. Gha]|uniref:hypothetical protein n=1 Tax=Bradyrhizobium sp. Gha TaxID=1855318 RepID=UPI0008EF26CE|nr:hypothetical protein [Bradyrhizobium sp. Gha]SFH84231.1 hypothetical protein SAMN05216525_102220 [Bradyrhizobium sp. Gha]
MTLYVLRRPHAEHMAREKDHEFLLLYADWLRAATDVGPEDESRIMELANFIYTSFVGMLNQWLAVQDADLFAQAMENLIRAGQELAARSLPKRSPKRRQA